MSEGNGKKNGKPAGKAASKAVLISANGGTLKAGYWGQSVGHGRPPSAVREALKELFADRLPVLANIIDGEPMRKTVVPLRSVLRHAHCPKCETKLVADDVDAAALVMLEGKTSASPGERVKAMQVAGDMSIGKMREISTADVKSRLEAQIGVIQSKLPLEQATELLDALDAVWK